MANPFEILFAYIAYLVSLSFLAPSAVRDLRVEATGPTTLKVTWKEPLQTGGRISQYEVKYRPLRLMACNKPLNAGFKTVSTFGELEYEIDNLTPYTQYVVEVRAKSNQLGEATSYEATTHEAGA